MGGFFFTFLSVFVQNFRPIWAILAQKFPPSLLLLFSCRQRPVYFPPTFELSNSLLGQFLATYFYTYIYPLIFLHLSADNFTPIRGYFYTYLQIILHLSADNFTPIHGYFYTYPRIFLHQCTDFFTPIRGYFYTSIQIKIYLCKKSLFHHMYVIKLMLGMLYAF